MINLANCVLKNFESITLYHANAISNNTYRLSTVAYTMSYTA